MKIKKRYKKFLKLWSKKIELQRYVTNIYESYNDHNYWLDYWLVIGGSNIFIGSYNNLGEFYWTEFKGAGRRYKWVKVLIDNGLKDKIKSLCELKEDIKSF